MTLTFWKKWFRRTDVLIHSKKTHTLSFTGIKLYQPYLVYHLSKTFTSCFTVNSISFEIVNAFLIELSSANNVQKDIIFSATSLT